MSLARVVFSATILLTFPIECLVTRAVVEAAWGHLESTQAYRGVTLIIVLAAYLLSVSTDCLGLVLELNVSVTLMIKLFMCIVLTTPCRKQTNNMNKSNSIEQNTYLDLFNSIYVQYSRTSHT